MGGAPVIEQIRPGVAFAPEAAASFRRAEAALGRQIDANSTTRDWDLQLRWWQESEAYAAGTGPKPNHSRAVHPEKSAHTRGEGLDSDDWTLPGFVAFMAEHGWIRTAAWDPTEQHHFEYQRYEDKYFGQPAREMEEDVTITDLFKEAAVPGGQKVKGSALIYLNPKRDVSVISGPAASVSGNLSVQLKAKSGEVVQIIPLLDTYKDGKKTASVSLGAQEIPATSGGTFGKVPVNCALGAGQRLRFQINGECTVISAVWRGTKFA